MIKYYSPCISVCTLKGDICTGCHRTVKEIAAWTGLNTIQKLTILRRINSPIVKEIERDLDEHKQSQTYSKKK